MVIPTNTTSVTSTPHTGTESESRADLGSDLPGHKPHDGIGPYNNPETERTESNQSSGLSRAADGGPLPTDAPEAGTAPELTGTSAGNPLEDVTLDDEDAEQAVSGDTGPEHPGTRRFT